MHRTVSPLIALASIAVLAAAPAVFAQESVAAMEPLAWLVGDWEGEGWIQRGPEGSRMEFSQTEHVESAFGGRILLVEGIGRTLEQGGEPGSGEVVHHAYGVLSYDPEAAGYRFDTYVVGESGVDADATIEDGVITWGFETEGGRIRFRIRRTEQDQWHENGEFSPDGTTWYPFFEMTLHRTEAGNP